MKFTKDELLTYLEKLLKKKDKIVFKSYYFNIYKNIIRDHPLVYKARVSSDYREGTFANVDPKLLRATQSTIDVANLIGILKGRTIPAEDAIAVAKVGGKYYIINGHHRVWLAMNLGETSVPAYVYDIDAYDKEVDKISSESAAKPIADKLKTREDIVDFGKSLIENGIYQIDVHSKYDSSFWSKWGRDDVVLQFLTGKGKGQPGYLDVNNSLSIEDRTINVSHLIKVASNSNDPEIIAFRKKGQFWVVEGYTSVYIAQKLKQSKLPAIIIDLGK